MDTTQFEGRKREHIQHALDPANQASGLGGLDRVTLVHEALPDLDFEEIRLESNCLGRMLPTPFFVAGMTAGHPDAPKLNRTLAEACQKRGWAMGVGSQRRELEASGTLLDEWRRLREVAPDLVLFANLGISQIIRASSADIRRVVEALDAQAIAVHANALQEALQPEGTPQFKGCLEALRRLRSEIDIPVILKETGCGFSASTLNRVRELGLAAVDVSGMGGTHWGRIEGARAPRETLQSQAALTFADWGIPTVESVRNARRAFGGSSTEVWATGGVRTGLDAAKLVALGANRVGYAKPALEAALQGAAGLDRWMSLQEYELRIALFCTGNRDPKSLRERKQPEHPQYYANDKESAWTISAI